MITASHPSFKKDIRDIIQIDKTTFIIATWSSLSAIRFETDNYLQSPFHIIDLTQHDSYYDPYPQKQNYRHPF